MASPSDLEGRVLAILDPRRNHRSLERRTCCALAAVTALLVIPCALLRLGYAADENTRETTAGHGNVPADNRHAAERKSLRDDRTAQLELDVAEAKYNAAKVKAEDDINVRYTIAAAEVAKAEYDVNRKANDVVTGSVPRERIDGLLLECKEADLAIEKAKRDQRIAGEEAKVAKAVFERAKRAAAEGGSEPTTNKEPVKSGPAKAGTTNWAKPIAHAIGRDAECQQQADCIFLHGKAQCNTKRLLTPTNPRFACASSRGRLRLPAIFPCTSFSGSQRSRRFSGSSNCLWQRSLPPSLTRRLRIREINRHCLPPNDRC
jgi:hypothetical protein